ncbi:MAG: SpoVG family protein [Planctomycetaceae bacterium]|nr:SpoVG family protein [Planctomycetaceae bacterium]
MNITEVRIKVCSNSQERLLGFCSITIDNSFVVRDLKIISGDSGAFVAMPSRKLCDRCGKCGYKNHLRANFCCQCGRKLENSRAEQHDNGRAKLFADIAHPINSNCRELIQQMVLEAYDRELVLSQEHGYICSYDDYGEENSRDAESSDDEDPAKRIDAPEQTPGAPHAAKPRAEQRQKSQETRSDEFGVGIFS